MFGKQFCIHLILTLSGLARVNYAMSYTESAYQKQEAQAIFQNCNHLHVYFS